MPLNASEEQEYFPVSRLLKTDKIKVFQQHHSLNLPTEEEGTYHPASTNVKPNVTKE